jgi:hypothetical protein
MDRDKDYEVFEFQDGREPRFQVTARIRPVSDDGVDQLELCKALIKSGVIDRTRGVQFQIIDNEIRVLFMVKSNTRFNIEPRLQDCQALLSATISRGLELGRFFAAFEMMKGQGKGR